MHYLCMMQSVNECCLLFRSVLMVTVTWFRLVLGTLFYMAVCHVAVLSVVVCDICLTLNASYILSLITAMWYGIFISQLDRRNC